jgi:WD40 repeat protein
MSVKSVSPGGMPTKHPPPVMPQELWHLIFRQLPREEVPRLNSVCKEWRRVSRAPSLWTTLLGDHFPYATPAKNDHAFSLFTKLLRAEQTTLSPELLSHEYDGKVLSYHLIPPFLCLGLRTGVEIHDLEKRFPPRFFKSQVGSINALKMYQGLLYTASEGGHIIAWNVCSGEQAAAFTSDDLIEPLHVLEVAEGYLCASTATEVRIWDLESRERLYVIRSEDPQLSFSLISNLLVQKNRLLITYRRRSNPLQTTINIWDLKERRITDRGIPHPGVSCLGKDHCLYSGLNGGIIVCSDLETGKVTRFSVPCPSQITCLDIQETFLCVGFTDGTLATCNVDVETIPILTIDADDDQKTPICALRRRGDCLYATQDNSIIIWDLNNEVELNAFRLEEAYQIIDIQIEGDYLFALARKQGTDMDTLVTLWHLSYPALSSPES